MWVQSCKARCGRSGRTARPGEGEKQLVVLLPAAPARIENRVGCHDPYSWLLFQSRNCHLIHVVFSMMRVELHLLIPRKQNEVFEKGMN